MKLTLSNVNPPELSQYPVVGYMTFIHADHSYEFDVGDLSDYGTTSSTARFRDKVILCDQFEDPVKGDEVDLN